MCMKLKGINNMNKKFNIMFFLTGLMVTSSYAGFYGNTAHSRGNCLAFNESITWNWSEYHWWSVRSMHFRVHGEGIGDHQVFFPMAHTWRAAAYHFPEAAGPMADNWWVQGYHYYMDYDGSVVYDAYTQSKDCSAYDGWWDKNEARGR